jgi:hypothetical protein
MTMTSAVTLSPQSPDVIEVKETANRYYALLARLSEPEKKAVSQGFDHGYALLIGVNENNVTGWALPNVAKDIPALGEVLAHPERCAYPKDNVKTITGKDATRDGILDGLDWLTVMTGPAFSFPL